MATFDQSGGDPKPFSHSHDPTVTELDQPAADSHDLPPDPLLQPGSFIDVNPGPNGQWSAASQPPQTGASEPLERDRHTDREPASHEPELRAEGPTTPAKEGAESTPTGLKGAPQSSAGAEAVPERPQWLPEGWKMEYRVRSSGVTAGSIDRYYVEPLSGRRFRSKKEVDYFLETGTKRKKNSTTDASADSSESPGGRKQKKSGTSTKKSSPLNFDFNNVPEMARWVLKDASNDHWMPLIDEKMVTKSTKQEWDAAFQSLSTTSTFRTM